MSKIDLDSVGQTREGTFKYDWKMSVLYNLGIGAQAEDLAFVYENVQKGMKVFPSFATIVAGSGLLFPKGTDFVRLLHGEQLIRFYVPFKPNGTINTKAVIEHIYDKLKLLSYIQKYQDIRQKVSIYLIQSMYFSLVVQAVSVVTQDQKLSL